MTKTRIGLVATALLAALGLFVWPTVYRYDMVRKGKLLIRARTNRLNGHLWYLKGGVWVRQYQLSELRDRLPADQASLVTIGCSSSALMGTIPKGNSVETVDWLVTHPVENEPLAAGNLPLFADLERCVVANQSDWQISSVTVELVPFDAREGKHLAELQFVRLSGIVAPGNEAVLRPGAPTHFEFSHHPAEWRFRVRILEATGGYD